MPRRSGKRNRKSLRGCGDNARVGHNARAGRDAESPLTCLLPLVTRMLGLGLLQSPVRGLAAPHEAGATPRRRRRRLARQRSPRRGVDRSAAGGAACPPAPDAAGAPAVRGAPARAPRPAAGRSPARQRHGGRAPSPGHRAQGRRPGRDLSPTSAVRQMITGAIALPATVRCERPRRSSTRTSGPVSFPTRHAPAFKQGVRTIRPVGCFWDWIRRMAMIKCRAA